MAAHQKGKALATTAEEAGVAAERWLRSMSRMPRQRGFDGATLQSAKRTERTRNTTPDCDGSSVEERCSRDDVDAGVE